ncbi:MAG: hypothetical protein J2P54_15345, partial [Bradyrhizobiaceae bacterium]|nr:hypothetical protein [Bradyrhizobiaceae bacterium]
SRSNSRGSSTRCRACAFPLPPEGGSPHAEALMDIVQYDGIAFEGARDRPAGLIPTIQRNSPNVATVLPPM